MAKLIRGTQFHQGFKVSQFIQGFLAPVGVNTQLPLLLVDLPQSPSAVKLLFGPIGGQNRLACLGVDFNVNVLNRTVTWLATARWALTPNTKVTIDYFTQGWLT